MLNHVMANGTNFERVKLSIKSSHDLADPEKLRELREAIICDIVGLERDLNEFHTQLNAIQSVEEKDSLERLITITQKTLDGFIKIKDDIAKVLGE